MIKYAGMRRSPRRLMAVLSEGALSGCAHAHRADARVSSTGQYATRKDFDVAARDFGVVKRNFVTGELRQKWRTTADVTLLRFEGGVPLAIATGVAAHSEVLRRLARLSTLEGRK